MRRLILLVLALLFIAACAPTSGPEKKALFIQASQGQVEVAIDVVSTPQDRSRGLMFREQLGEREGMWFVFEESSPYSFWMKNTLMPLDIVFVDEHMAIVDIIQADPCQQDPCPTYTPKASARYVLEVNQNFTARAGVKAGNRVTVR